MRKDLVMGLSIGGALLALVVIYVVWTPRSTPKGPGVNVGDLSTGAVAQTPTTHPSSAVKLPAPSAAISSSSAAPTADENNFFVRALYHSGSTPLQAYQASADRSAPATHPAGALSPALTPARPAPAPPAVAAIVAPPPNSTPAVVVPPVNTPAPVAGAVPAAPAAPAAAMHTYIVKQGDTPSSIAASQYGNANFYPYILRANPKLDPSHMKIDMVINLPDVAAIHQESARMVAPTALAAEHAQVAIDTKTQYIVQNGDSLYRISIKLYGNSSMVDAIYDANKDVIGADPAALKLHQALKLPKPLSAAPTTQN
jgi:nucleoid-associated protein YgaU